MVYHARSGKVKKGLVRADEDARMAAAVQEWRFQQNLPPKQQLSFRKLADRHHVAKSTLQDREEQKLVDLIVESASQGFPLDRQEVELFANAVLETRVSPDSPDATVGKTWYFDFCARHHSRLQSHWSSPLDTQRAQCLNPNAVTDWFALVKKHVVDLGIEPEMIFGMDESGFPRGNTGKSRVLGARGTKTQHKQGGANRENVTAIVTICADGTTVPPMIISVIPDGQRSNEHLSISASENGWTDASLGREWTDSHCRWA